MFFLFQSMEIGGLGPDTRVVVPRVAREQWSERVNAMTPHQKMAGNNAVGGVEIQEDVQIVNVHVCIHFSC